MLNTTNTIMVTHDLNNQARITLLILLSQSAALEKREHLYKVLVIGELGVGKTSIIKRYVHQFFSVHYRATVSELGMRERWRLDVTLHVVVV